MTRKSRASIAGCIRHHWLRFAPVAPYIPAASDRLRIPHIRPSTGSCGFSSGSRKNALPASRGASSVETPSVVRAAISARPAGVDGSAIAQKSDATQNFPSLASHDSRGPVGGRSRRGRHPSTDGIAAMSIFTEAELRYLAGGRQLGRIATVGADGTPHVVPVAWIYNAARETIDVGGNELERSKKFRDVERSERVAIVIDDLASTDPWHPRGIEIRGRGEAIALPTPLIRIYPERIVSWGIEARRSARTVAR